MEHMASDELTAMIPSETVRQYALDTGWHFTDIQKAALLYHNCRPLERQYEHLRRLMEQTADETLREQISNYLAVRKKGLRVFKENEDKTHIYVLRVMDEDEKWYDLIQPQGYFFRWDLAFACGQQQEYPFQIEKCRVDDAKVPNMDDIAACAEIGFDESGMASSFWSREVPFCEEEDGSFTCVFYEVPNPFERGDIVRLAGTEEYGIVETSQEDWTNCLLKQKSPDRQQKGYCRDYSDVQIRVVFPDDEGVFAHKHINPVYLERCSIDKDKADSLLKLRLLSAAEFYHENQSLDEVYRRYMEEYQKFKSNLKGKC